MIVFVVAPNCTNNKFKQWRQQSSYHRWPCLFNFATVAPSFHICCCCCSTGAAIVPIGRQLLVSAFVFAVSFSSTWPTNRLQIERKHGTSYAPAMPNRPSRSLAPLLPPHPYQPGMPTCNLRQRRRHCSMTMARPVSASFVVWGQSPFCRCASVLRFIFFPPILLLFFLSHSISLYLPLSQKMHVYLSLFLLVPRPDFIVVPNFSRASPFDLR